MVAGGMVLCKIIGQILRSFPPAHLELSLLYAILDPAESHVHSLRPSLLDAIPDAVELSTTIAVGGCG